MKMDENFNDTRSVIKRAANVVMDKIGLFFIIFLIIKNV